MKTAIIYKSIHQGNTKKIAESIAKPLEAELLNLTHTNKDNIKQYDLIGFGSGIYNLRPHKDLRNFIEELDNMENKKAFIFSTSGRGKPNKKFTEELSTKGFKIIGEFHCKGLSAHGLSKIFGSVNKGRPNEDDLKNAEEFAKGLK